MEPDWFLRSGFLDDLNCPWPSLLAATIAAATRTLVRELPDFTLMIDGDSAWGTARHSATRLLSGRYAGSKTNTASDVKVPQRRGWSGAHDPTFRSRTPGP